MNKAIKICLWTLACIPLIIDNTPFTPANSNFFMRSILILASILFLIHFISSQQFKVKITEKIKSVIKNPLVIAVSSFVFLSIISTIFAIDKYTAFWGNTDRAEGLVGIVYFFSFFVFSLLIFEKKDWLWFLKLSLLTSVVLIFAEFIQRNSLVGNTTYLSGYLLFSIFSSIVVFSEIKDKFWKYLSITIFPLSVLGIFIAQTRGTIVGLAVAFITVLIYGVFKGKDVFYKKFNPVRNREGSQRPSISNGVNLRKISIAILCFLFIFSSLFFVTRKNEIWQKVPGFSRIATIGSTDATTQTRLMMYKLSLDAINPAQNGWKKLLIGWGPENFSLAYGQYFNPKQFQYEKAWFNRAHNELFDKLVMTGLLGLLAYLTIWFFFFKFFLKKKEVSLLNMGLLFFGTSFLVHLLFIFNQMTTFIPFFAVLSFAVYLNIDDSPEKNIKKTKSIFAYIFFSILALFLCFVFIKNDLPAFIQIKEYDSLRREGDATKILNKVDEVFEPFTTAQMQIRDDLLLLVSSNYDPKNEDIIKLSNISFLRGEEYISRVPYDLQFLAILANAYTNQGYNTNNPEFLKKGEEYSKKLLLLAPNRQDFNSVLALNWLYQKRYDESFNLFEKVFNTNPEYFIYNNMRGYEGAYGMFIKHFYEVRDKENFIKTAKRLIENQYAGSAALNQIINFIQKTNIWPVITF